MRENVQRVPIGEALPSEPSGGAKDGRVAALMQTLEAGTEAILTSEGFQAYLRMQTRFWQYSATNTLLIMMQYPDASLVNSYDRWHTLNRQVKKGERGIKIFYPFKKKLVDEESGDEVLRVMGFGVGNVFAYEQTEGEPLAEPPTPAERFGTSDVAGEIDRRLSLWAIGQGLRLAQKPLPAIRGYFSPDQREIVLNAALPADDGRLKTLVHETAHFVAGHKGWRGEKQDAETIAEGSAFVVLRHFGMDTADYSFPYVARFARSTALLRSHLQTIQQVSSTLIGAIETERPEEAGEWL